MLLKKQGLSSIGFRKKNLWPALCLGLLFSIIPLMLNDGILPGIIYGYEPRSFGMILYITVGTFIFAASEDICETQKGGCELSNRLLYIARSAFAPNRT